MPNKIYIYSLINDDYSKFLIKINKILKKLKIKSKIIMRIKATALITILLSMVSARPPFWIDGDWYAMESMKYFTVD